MAADNDVSEEVLDVANEIAKYLEHNENTADTIEGIANWWLLRQRLQEEEAKVKKAVDYLYAQRLIEKRVLSDGRELYFRARRNP